jgi:hypothetical protein
LACRRLGQTEPVFGTVKLFAESATGWQVQLPDWRYPVVCDVDQSKLHFDNFEGRWGNHTHLDHFLQIYAVEKARLEARKLGYCVTEQSLADGSIKVAIQTGT